MTSTPPHKTRDVELVDDSAGDDEGVLTPLSPVILDEQVRAEIEQELSSSSLSPRATAFDPDDNLYDSPSSSPSSRLPGLFLNGTSKHASSGYQQLDATSSTAEHLIDADGKVRRYHHRPSITIDVESNLLNQTVLVPASPVSPASAAAITLHTPTGRGSPTFLNRWLGFIMLAVSAFCFSLMSLFVSLTGGRVNSMMLVMWRCFVQFSISVIILLYQRVPLLGPKEMRKWIFMRGLVGMVSLSCFYYALTHLPLSEATVLFFTAPIWDWFDSIASACSFIGVICVARPAFLFGSSADTTGDSTTTGSSRAVGVMIALTGAFISAWVYIFIRKIGKGTHPLILVHYLGWIGFTVAPVDLIFETWSVPSGTDCVYMVFVGFWAFCGQSLFNAGVQKEKAGISSLIRNLDIVFAFIWQITVEQLAINGWSFVGALIVTGSVVALGLRKWQRERSTAIKSAAAVPDSEAESSEGWHAARVIKTKK